MKWALDPRTFLRAALFSFATLDFADVVCFPPHETEGIAVLRLPKSASLRLLTKLMIDFLTLLRTEPITLIRAPLQ